MTTNIPLSEKAERREILAGLIDEARKHVYEARFATPLVRLNYDGPSEIYLKLECLQPIGSFKIRGAYNAVRLLPEEQRRCGVWTVSAGNAAQGMGLAALRAGVPCQVLVMDTAPAAKLDAMRRLGAEYVKASFDECWTALSERSHPAMKGVFVHPFEDDEFIAGNASLGLEIPEDLPDVDCVVAAFWGWRLIVRDRGGHESARTEGKGVGGRTGNCGTAGTVADGGLGAECSRLEGELGRRMRRQVGLPAHVESGAPPVRRFHRLLS